MIPFKVEFSANRGRILFALAATLIPVVPCGFMVGFDIASAHAEFGRTATASGLTSVKAGELAGTP